MSSLRVGKGPPSGFASDWRRNASDRFSAAWERGPPPNLQDFLPADPALRSEALSALVPLDLDYRWTRAGLVESVPTALDDTAEKARRHEMPARPRVEDYQRRFPEVAADLTLLVHLVAAEYRTRCRVGRRPSQGEYLERFPGLKDEILSALACVDAHLLGEAEDPLQTVPPPDRMACTAREVPPACGRYRVASTLGEGAFGVVYRGFDEELRREVAIKVPHRKWMESPEAIGAYLEEARRLAQLDHPSIVPIYDFGRTDDGLCYLVSKYVDGGTLGAEIECGTTSHGRAVQLVAAVADALQHAHERRLVHRDIKPANILLDRSGHPLVADFGLALTDDAFGQTAGIVGTPAYMSPEQARGEGHRVDGRSDIYSLGVVFYELLTGRRPYRHDSVSELLDEIANAEIRPPRHLRPAIPRELERICLKALCKRACDRYPAALDLADDLRHWLAAHGDNGRAAVGEHEGRCDQTAASIDAPPSPAGVPIMPKGLRSFDASDSYFFLQLLPGPRDREGLPESIRFWKSRIEQTDAGQTFAVGLLYGPSGCGKSSLVKAGLLPRLEPNVVRLYVEATAKGTEAQLLNGLRRCCPGLSHALDLAESFAALRRGELGHRKVLIVLDQFEQWLHGKRRTRGGLIKALRQCDGEHVQCLVMVRDDFWLAATRFFADLEIDLMPGRNTALVDLFDLDHSEKVLFEFGRAFARLPDAQSQLKNIHRQFLKQAVRSLAHRDRVVCVRLSVFAEMMKSKPWNTATLRQLGGAKGIGVAFLEETFCSDTAPVRNQLHRPGAQSVLTALLPKFGADIKGHMRSHAELLATSGYSDKPKEFDELLHILDGARLITPVNRNDPGRDDTRPQRFYQLSHDYLVHPLRDWLTQKNRETRRGRAELLLEQCYAAWIAHPDSRRLPSIKEAAVLRLSCAEVLANYAAAEPDRLFELLAKSEPLQFPVIYAACLQNPERTAERAREELATAIRDDASEDERERYFKRKSNAAVALFSMAQTDSIRAILKGGCHKGSRSYFIHQFSLLNGDPERLLGCLKTEPDSMILSALLLALGELSEIQLPQLRREDLRGTLLAIHATDPSAAVHSAAEWLLRKWKVHELGAQIKKLRSNEPALRDGGILNQREWYITTQGQTMMVLDTGESEVDTRPSNTLVEAGQKVRPPPPLNRRLAVAALEVSIAQFRLFSREWLKDSLQRSLVPNIHLDALSKSRLRQFPLTTILDVDLNGGFSQRDVTWYEAAGYCNWLSEKEGIPREQWCYEANHQGKYAAGMKTKPNHRSLIGYRLPTETEWEFACRAGSSTRRYYGAAESLLPKYAWYRDNSDERFGLPGRGGRLKPNDFGLFDALGNLNEWCENPFTLRREPAAVKPTSSIVEQLVRAAMAWLADRNERAVRGGSYLSPAADMHAARREGRAANRRMDDVGFRVARTLSTDGFP